ncbi:PEP-CTERM sorting domain-containing protein [Viridibacterium curvum]|uniref:Ice-binding protein C-terminal domain-containing protein n=1 Tax=Viridibacterium curvum TaxID=1101404 RepID=A0ABP9QL90_9RHOO
MKMKALVAAMALVSGVANAGYATFADANNPGSLIFSAYDATASSFFDLGLNTSQFTAANFGGVTSAGAGFELKTLQVTWNFNTGSVTSTGQYDVSSLLAGVSGDWSAAWTAYQSHAAGSQWDVFAADRNGSTADKQYFLTTAVGTQTAVSNTTNGVLQSGFATIANWHDNQQLTGGGNHGSVDNGANVITDTSSGLYQGATNAMKTNWNGKVTTWAATGSATSELDFYGLQGGVNGAGSTAKVGVTNFNGKFALNADTGVLTWTTQVAVAAVPEASTYAMLLAGLGLMGLMARRRVK